MYVLMAQHTGIRIAELGFLLLALAGAWLAAAQMPTMKGFASRTIVPYVAIAVAGVLLIIASHWGHFG